MRDSNAFHPRYLNNNSIIMSARENAISQALSDLNSGIQTSQNSVATSYNIPRSTLQERLKGRTNARESHEHQQRLSRNQEEFLVEWILEEDERGFPPSHARTREMAARILRINGDTKPLGKKWVVKFLERNPRVKSVVGRKIEAVRLDGTSQQALEGFFQRFQEVRDKYNVLLENIWNMDEHGIALGVCTNSQVLASASKKRTYTKSPESREWVSILEAISTTGSKIKPLVIFKGKSLQTSWFHAEHVPDWLYTTSENGWTSNNIAMGWLHTIFIPETKPTSNQARILVCDGHGSHISVDFLFDCKQYDIHLIFLPPHCSHVLQPLDLSGFSPVKSRYRTEIAQLASLDDAAPVKKSRFIKCYNKAREESFTTHVIRAGWKAAGLSPWNPQKVLQSSQVKHKVATPPRKPLSQQPLGIDITTPRRPQDIYKAAQALRTSSIIDRRHRLLLVKSGKAIGDLNSSLAAVQQENLQLKHKLEALESKGKRQKVVRDPNKVFDDILNIKAALDKAAEQKAIWEATKPEERAKKATAAARALDLNDMCSEWQL